MQIPIKRTVERIPGGFMLVPLLAGAVTHTFVPHAAQFFGSFTGALFEGALMDLLDGAADFIGFGWLDFGKKRFCEKGPLRGVLDNIHRVAGLAGGEGLQGGISAKMFKPCGLVGKGLCG